MQKQIFVMPKMLIWILAVVLVVLVQLTYQDNSAGTFHFDDRFSIVEHQPIHIDQLTVSNLLQAGSNALHSTRPIPSITFAFDWWRGGGDAAAFLQSNLLIHTLNALLVMMLLILIIRQRYPDQNVAAIGLAFIAAAIWALHPIQVQGVSYIVQRMASLATLFTLLALISYLWARTTSTRWLRGLGYGICLLSLLMGMASKEIAWIAPMLILFAEYSLLREHKKPLFRGYLDGTILLLPVMFAMLVAFLMLANIGPVGHYFAGFYVDRDFDMFERLLTQPSVILFYFSLLLWPLPGRFSLEHDVVTASSLISPISTLPAILLILAWLVITIYLWRIPGRRFIAFLMMWVPLTLAIESSILGLEMLFEHRMYLPLVGVVGLLAVGGMSAICYSRKLIWPVVATSLVIILLLAMSTYQRIPTWNSTEALLINSTQHASSSARSWSNLGRYYLDRQDFEKALPAIKKALMLSPQHPSALEGMGVILLSQGDLAQAREHMITAYRTNRVGHSWLNNMALLHLAEVDQGVKPLSWIAKGVEFSRQAQQQAPRETRYVKTAALLYERLGNCPAAFAEWQRYQQLPIAKDELAWVSRHLQSHYRQNGQLCRFR